MTVWVSSDIHFLHKKCSEIRGYAQPVYHDQVILANFNKVIRDDDILWLLGDMGIAAEDDTLALLSQLKGRKQLVTGNHDPCHPQHRNARKHQRKWLEVFESVQAFARINICGHDFLASHYPYSGDHTAKVRYSQFRLRDEGHALLHGHTHSSEKVADPSRPDVIHVGVDAWNLSPVKDVEIKALLLR